MISKLTRFFALIAIFSLPFTCFPMFNGEPESNFSKFAFNIAKGPIIIWSASLANALIHELGHAIPAKILFNNPIKIHIGDIKSSPLFTLAGITLHKAAVNPSILWETPDAVIVGGTEHNLQTRHHDYKIAKIMAGGPAAGIAFSCALAFTASQISGDHPFNKFLLRYAALNSLSINIQNLLITPSGNSDGTKLAQALGYSIDLNQDPEPNVWNCLCVLPIVAAQGTKIVLAGYFIYKSLKN